jgi:hypothetical protein
MKNFTLLAMAALLSSLTAFSADPITINPKKTRNEVELKELPQELRQMFLDAHRKRFEGTASGPVSSDRSCESREFFYYRDDTGNSQEDSLVLGHSSDDTISLAGSSGGGISIVGVGSHRTKIKIYKNSETGHYRIVDLSSGGAVSMLMIGSQSSRSELEIWRDASGKIDFRHRSIGKSTGTKSSYKDCSFKQEDLPDSTKFVAGFSETPGVEVGRIGRFPATKTGNLIFMSMTETQSYDQARAQCASLAPLGKWRLPTKAEAWESYQAEKFGDSEYARSFPSVGVYGMSGREMPDGYPYWFDDDSNAGSGRFCMFGHKRGENNCLNQDLQAMQADPKAATRPFSARSFVSGVPVTCVTESSNVSTSRRKEYRDFSVEAGAGDAR